MSPVTATQPRPAVEYPESDGAPIAENTLQYQWIVTITGGIEYLFADDPDVFVGADLFWYPVEGRPDIRIAPDTVVAFGRPRGHRGSYRQWEEGGVPLHVVFEVLSPSNRFGEMSRKYEFYRRHGVEEYYIFNPDPLKTELAGFVRQQDALVEVARMDGHVSPRLGVRFDLPPGGELRIVGPDGQPFLTFAELARREEAERLRAESERERVDRERDRADRERDRADWERERADQERERAEQAAREVEVLRERLRALGEDTY